jgi:hypothetical protein
VSSEIVSRELDVSDGEFLGVAILQLLMAFLAISEGNDESKEPTWVEGRLKGSETIVLQHVQKSL